MSLHYLLDGYNIIHKVPEFLEGKLQDQRNHLIRFLETRRPHGSSRNQVTVVFDGQPDVWHDGEHTGVVRVIFTSNESADEKIKRMVRRAGNPKNMIVVTDDREIQYAIGAAGATSITVDAFMSFKKKAKRGAVKPSKREKSIAPEHEADINKEMEEIWLKKKKKEG